MLGIRVAEGLALSERAPVAARLADSGLLEPAALERGIALLTLDGRLLADRVAVTLLSPAVSALEPPG